jgi:hypothetical protein
VGITEYDDETGMVNYSNFGGTAGYDYMTKCMNLNFRVRLFGGFAAFRWFSHKPKE